MLNTNFSDWPSFSREEAKKAKDVLLSNKVNYWTGNEVKLFEKEFANYCNVKYSVALSNGTIAIDAALKALEIGSGDEVIVTSRTFIASASSIVNANAKPIFVDVDENSQNIDPIQIKKHITKNTKAIICVHLAGWACEMDEIKKLIKDRKIYLIEDCAQAHGAVYKGKPVGSIGDIGCWSFCQDKILTTAGEGGMITTNNRKLWKKIWQYKDHGKSYDLVYKKNSGDGFRWLHNDFGTNWRMTEIQGAIGRIQLRKLDDWIDIRNLNQNKIWETASKLQSVRVPDFKCSSCSCKKSENCRHAAYKCYIFIKPEMLKKSWSRDLIVKEINKLGVPCYTGTCSEIYKEKCFKNKKLQPNKFLKNARALGETSIMFLVHPSLKAAEIKKTCDVLKAVVTKATKL